MNRFVARGFATAITTPRGAAKSNFEFPKSDVHVIDVVGQGKPTVTPVYDMQNLHDRHSKLDDIKEQFARLYVVEDLSAPVIEALSNTFGCGTEYFHGHFQRAGDDVSLVLPSVSRSQAHLVILYKRTYKLSPCKEIREYRNLRRFFAHGVLVTTEEHASVWFSSDPYSSVPATKSWKGQSNLSTTLHEFQHYHNS